MELKDLKMYQRLRELDTTLSEQTKTIYELTYETINNISKFYDNYTMHDMNHGLRVASYMEQLAFGIDEKFNDRISKYSALELTLMILSAILHDIGMTIRDIDKENIKNNKIEHTESLTFEGVMKVVNNNENEAIKEIIRRTHAARIFDFIDCDIGGKTISSILMIDNSYPYAEDVAEICKAHGEDHSYLKRLRTENTKGKYTYNLQYIAALLRIADYLDLDKQRTPILWYSVMRIEGFSREEWEKNFTIQNSTKLKEYIDGKMQIYFDGKSSDAKIHRKYLRYIDELKKELEETDELLNTKTAHEKYRFNVSTKLEDRVKTEGFTYSDLRLNLDYSAITNLLMGKNIYGDCRLGLRELIQNSIDACELMEEEKRKNNDIIMIPAEIYIIYSKDKGYVKIKDTGIGMTLEVVKKHFLNVGKSYYKSNEYLFKNHSYKPIGHYGIGFLACFLLSDTVTVKTKYYSNNEINQIELEKCSEYVVTTSQQTPNFFGTEIVLNYEKFFNVFNDVHDLKSFLETYFYTKIPIKIRDDDSGIMESISNIYAKNIDSVQEKEAKYKTYKIDCSKYVDGLKGNLVANLKGDIDNISLRTINTETTYVYNSDLKKFELFANTSKKIDGHYKKIRYMKDISTEDYTDIKLKEKSDNLCAKLLGFADENNQRIDLFIEENHFFDIMPHYGRFTDEDILKKILEASGLNFYEDVLVYSNFFDLWVKETKYVQVNYCYFADSKLYIGRHDREEDDEIMPSCIYNKGILVPDFGAFRFYTPFNLISIYGYVNSISLPVKLDVSRKSIIEGGKILKENLFYIIMSHFNSLASPETKSIYKELGLIPNLTSDKE